MGLKSVLRNKHVYFDTNIFIYLLEGNDMFSDPIGKIEELLFDAEIRVSSSSFVFTEILPPHAKNNDQEAIKDILGFLEADDLFEILPVGKNICVHAGLLRGETGMKSPDAIHVSSAIQAGCDVFLTNDKGIRVPDNMERVLFSDFATRSIN